MEAISKQERDEQILQWQRLVRGLACKFARRTKGLCDPDDLEQEAYLKLLEVVEQWDPSRAKVCTFIGKVAYRAMYSYLDQEQRHGMTPTYYGTRFHKSSLNAPASLEEDAPQVMDNLASFEPSPFSLACLMELKRRLLCAVQQLPAQQGQALILRYGSEVPGMDVRRGLAGMRMRLRGQGDELWDLARAA